MVHGRFNFTEIARKIKIARKTKHRFGGGMIDSARLVVIRTIISRRDVGNKISYQKYEKDLSNI